MGTSQRLKRPDFVSPSFSRLGVEVGEVGAAARRCPEPFRKKGVGCRGAFPDWSISREEVKARFKGAGAMLRSCGDVSEAFQC